MFVFSTVERTDSRQPTDPSRDRGCYAARDGRSANIPTGEHFPKGDHRVVLADATWEHYEMQLAMRGEKSVPRIAYEARRFLARKRCSHQQLQRLPNRRPPPRHERSTSSRRSV